MADNTMRFTNTRKAAGAIAALLLAVFVLQAICLGDTFTNRQTGQQLHGYATTRSEGKETVVRTQEQGETKLDLTQWQVTADRQGRNNKVIVLTIDNKIMLELEAEMFEQAITKAVDEGPVFILLEIDTPGGRIDLTKRFCTAIGQAGNCQVYGFVKGGEHGGAISAGVAVAMACRKIYVVGSTVIGAAAPMLLSKSGPQDLKQFYGEEVGEKVSSAWRTYLASLAEQNHKPGLIVGAMVDRDIEVIEVTQENKRLFIEPINKTAEQSIVHTWSQKGSLLTLTADDAVKCGIADRIVKSRRELLQYLEADDAQIDIDDSFQRAEQLVRRAKIRFNNLSRSLDLKVKQANQTQNRLRAMQMLREITEDYKSLIVLAKRYPDLQVNVVLLEQQLNSVEAMHKELKMIR